MNNAIRITSGKLRGRSIKSPNISMTHPMGAREKIALFNMISDYLPGARVLDAYAGSGALGIEALSRGVREVVFVEKDKKACKTIRENLSGLNQDSEIIMMDVANYNPSTKFDIIIADPPYDRFEPDEIMHLSRNLTSDGIFVLSHPGDAPELPSLSLQKTANYAGAHISIYRPEILAF